MDELDEIAVKVAQLEGLTKAYVDTIKDLVERVEKLEEFRHNHNPMSSRFTRREYVDGSEEEEKAKEMEKKRNFNWGRPPNCS